MEGYVDDCAVAGVVETSFSWLREVRSIYATVFSAGFQVLDHECFWGFALAEGLPWELCHRPSHCPPLYSLVATWTQLVQGKVQTEGLGLRSVIGRADRWRATSADASLAWQIGALVPVQRARRLLHQPGDRPSKSAEVQLCDSARRHREVHARRGCACFIGFLIGNIFFKRPSED